MTRLPGGGDLGPVDNALLTQTTLHTLAPHRSRATLPSELADELLDERDDVATRAAFCEGLGHTVFAMLDAFPENLLWDLDYLAARVLRDARTAADPAGQVGEIWSGVAALQRAFGRRGPIRFRYIHDFIYGFDWARWVAKDPPARHAVGPFDPVFIDRMRGRGEELVAAIASGDDREYPPLVGHTERNPFGFSREPDVELGVHKALAAAGELPVAAWDIDAKPHWDAPFAALRTAAARRLHRSAG